MGIKQMQGVSAFIEYIGPKGRKRRDTCAYFLEGNCDYDKAQTYNYKCVSRMYCENFDDTDETKNRVLLDRKRKYKALKNQEHPLLNKNIKLEDVITKKVFVIKIVKGHEASPGLYKFSENSKVARAFKNCKVNSEVQFNLYGKKFKFKIISID